MSTPRKPASPTPIFLGRWHKLSSATRNALIQLLSIDEELAADPIGPLNDVCLALGTYQGMVEHIENPPRAKDYVLAMNTIKDRCFELHVEINRLGDWMGPWLESHFDAAENLAKGSQIHRVQNEVLRMLGAAERAADAMRAAAEAEKPQGRKPRSALREVIAQLADIFRKCRPQPGSNQDRKPFEPRDPWEVDLLCFIDVALKEAKIPVPGTEETRNKKLMEYLRHK